MDTPSKNTASNCDTLRKFFFGGLVASLFGVATFVGLFVCAVVLQFEETDANIIALWTAIVGLVGLLGGVGLTLGYRHCDSQLIRVISLGITIAIVIAVVHAWCFTDHRPGIAIWALLLLPTSGIIAACAFVASLTVALWLKLKAIGKNAV